MFGGFLQHSESIKSHVRTTNGLLIGYDIFDAARRKAVDKD